MPETPDNPARLCKQYESPGATRAAAPLIWFRFVSLSLTAAAATSLDSLPARAHRSQMLREIPLVTWSPFPSVGNLLPAENLLT